MAILKHFAVKNADYGAVIDYLKYQHDEFHLVPILDENGNSMLRDEFYFDGLNCNPEAFDLECELLNQQYHKNQRYDEIKCHHYIISHDPMDVADHGLTGEQAQAIGMEYAKANFPGHQALVCTHTDGSNNSGNIHTHIIINSLRKEDIASQPYTERAIDCKAGYKHHLTKEYLRHLQSSLMDICQREGLYQVDLLSPAAERITQHAMGYAQESGYTYARPFVKYTPTWPRSFTPASQKIRNRVAKMKQIPVPELIEGKKLLFVDDSIVRGTQLGETVEFLYSTHAKEVHMRSACPPIMYGCKYLNFTSKSSEDDLLARRIIHELEGLQGDAYLEEYADASTERGQCMLKRICEKLGFASLGFQSLDGLLEAIGLPKEKVCTYCWNGKE